MGSRKTLDQPQNHGQRPFSALITNPSPRFLDTRCPTVIPRGIYGDPKSPDKPITSSSYQNKLRNQRRQKQGREKKLS
ncbi:hypothetical protein E6H33_01650 [Candidatus Bathyarchaeota archaeon]|nr:MAG: hypothetical protein E6H33_01650 [Candidatus Bathyarchaeota archaeon]